MLDRFIKAQEKYFNIAEAELKNGRKESHWMWFIFPQIIGLGESETSVYYAIESIEEAKEYMKNEYLSKNYDSLCRILLRLEEKAQNEQNEKLELKGEILLLKGEIKLLKTVLKHILGYDELQEEEIQSILYVEGEQENEEV